jgi:hypothetical protein
MNKLQADVFLYLIETIAHDIIDECTDVDDHHDPRKIRSCFVEKGLSEYARLCRVNRRFFQVLSSQARVDGKLLKTTLMELSISSFTTMLYSGAWVSCDDCGEYGVSVHTVSIKTILDNWGPIWKNRRLLRTLLSLVTFCSRHYSEGGYFSDNAHDNEISATLLYWLPITFKNVLQENVDVDSESELHDFLKIDGKRLWRFEFTMGPYRIDLPDKNPLKDMDGRHLEFWKGISLNSYRAWRDGGVTVSGERDGNAGEFEQWPYWLWYRELPDRWKRIRYIYYIVDYTKGTAISQFWDDPRYFPIRELTEGEYETEYEEDK